MLIGNKVKLRGVEREDMKLAYKYMNDPEVSLNLMTSIPYPITLDMEMDWYESQKKSNSTYNYSIESVKDNLYIGGCGINK